MAAFAKGIWNYVVSEAVFRLFMSSPGDVAAERARAEAVVERLNAEFKDRAQFDAVFWEDHFYSAHGTFQEQIREAADCDIVIAIFRSRLGSPLPPYFKRQLDGEPYPSGSAYEVLSAIAKRRSGAQLPDIYVFRYPRDPVVSLDDPERGEIEKQWTALKDFFARWFKAPAGQFYGAFQPYDSPDDFAELFEDCLRQWLARRGIITREIWNRERLGSPFPGLAAFDAKYEYVFFGRDLAIRHASERLRSARIPFLLILGASGAGKSSLLRAGLMPKLKRPGAIPEIDHFRPVVMEPGLDPLAELAKAVLEPEALGSELASGRFADESALTEAFRGDPKTAAAVIGEALDKVAKARQAAAHYEKPRAARLLLAVDQAERLFSEVPRDADAFGALLQALTVRDAYVILAMRADAYARFQACQPLLALRAAGATFDLVPPTSAELVEIVARPVAACEPPLALGPSDPPLAERLVADAKGGDALPLLQMTLNGLYKAQETRGDGVLRAEDYKGMGAAVTEASNAAMAPLGKGGRQALEALVAGLVSDVAADPITGEPAPVVVALDRDTFIKDKPHREALVNAFVEARLLTVEGGARVRPTHDALLRIWPEAVALVKKMGPLIRARHSLTPLAQAWAEAAPADKSKHLEISAPLLVSGRQLEAQFGEDLRAPLRPFIRAADEHTKDKSRNRLFLGIGAAAFALMAVFGVALQSLLPLAILVFGIQHLFSRLRGVSPEGRQTNTWREHAVSILQRVSIGVLPGALFAALLMAIPYHSAWVQEVTARPGSYDQVKPLESVILEISYTTMLGAYTLGFFTLFFAQVRVGTSEVVLSSTTSPVKVLIGSVFGGVLSGLIVGSVANLYFGRMSRPEIALLHLLPAAIVGSTILVFSIVNDMANLTLRRIRTGLLAAIVALLGGALLAAILFGGLLASGKMNWMQFNSASNAGLAAGGALHGILVGVVLGAVIGGAVVLTERWSRKALSA